MAAPNPEPDPNPDENPRTAWSSSNTPFPTPPPENTTPLFRITFADGTHVTCAFDETSRVKFERWLKENKPGTVCEIRGTYWGTMPGGGYLMTNCTVLPDGFR